MVKLGVAAASTGFTATSTAVVCGAYAMGAFGGAKEGDNKGLYISTLKDTKTDNVNKCLQEIFKGGTSTSSSLSQITSTSDVAWNGNDDTNGCLVYNGEKKNQSNNGEGSKFHLIGTLSKGDVGVAVDLTATVKSNTSVEFDGFSYVLKKEGENWKPTHKLGLKGGNKMTIDSKDGRAKFPMLEQNDFPKKAVMTYGGFLDDSGNKIKTSGEQTSQQWWRWGPKNGSTGNYSLKDGSPNFNTWWDYFFEKDKLDMMQLMKNADGKGS